MLLLFIGLAIGAILAVNEYIQCYSIMHKYIYFVYYGFQTRFINDTSFWLWHMYVYCAYVYYVFYMIDRTIRTEVFQVFLECAFLYIYISKSYKELDSRRRCLLILKVYL